MNLPAPTWQSLQQAADHARMAAAHEQAIALYTEALAQPDVPWPTINAMRMARAESWCMLGNYDAMDRDLTALADVAAALGDDAAHANVLAALVFNLRYQGDLQRCHALGQRAVQAAARAGLPDLMVVALYTQGIIQVDMSRLRSAQATLETAEALLSPEDIRGRIRTVVLRAYLLLRLGDHQQALSHAEDALQSARANGWPIWEAFSLNLVAIAEPDLARQGLLLDQLLAAWTDLGDRPNQCVTLYNLDRVVYGVRDVRTCGRARQAGVTDGSVHANR